MNVLVTGGAGYLGATLIPKLLVRGHQVRVVDIGYFGISHLLTLRPAVEIITEDIRLVRQDASFLDELLKGIDAVIHLAAISNDASADLDPQLTDEVNVQATTALAEAAKARQIRFLFASSSSVYGDKSNFSEESVENENPQVISPDSVSLSTYSLSKLKAEHCIAEFADESWSPVILRSGTLFGYSPRMRFDLVINIFSLNSILKNEITIFGDGLQWRPYLHVKDCARAFIHLMEQPRLPQVYYNVAHQNLRVIDVARVFLAINPHLKIVHSQPREPNFDGYRMATQHLIDEGFQPHFEVKRGVEEMVEAIVTGIIPNPESDYYRNAPWLSRIMSLNDHTSPSIIEFATDQAPAAVQVL